MSITDKKRVKTTKSIIDRFSFKDISSLTKILSMTDTQSNRNNVDDTLTWSNNDIFDYRLNMCSKCNVDTLQMQSVLQGNNIDI